MELKLHIGNRNIPAIFTFTFCNTLWIFLCSAEQQCVFQPDGEISVTQPTLSDEELQENVRSYGHKMVLLLLYSVLFDSLLFI